MEEKTERNTEVSREQGDINTSSSRRKYWERNLNGEAEKIFEKDKKYFLQQALSTPVLNVLKKTEGIYLEDFEGRKYIDMHGNGVHKTQ